MTFSEQTYQKFRSIFPPKLRANIYTFKTGAYYFLPTYHGCGKKQNRNGTNKKINYRNGDMCLKATYKYNWKDWDEINFYLLPRRMYLTRFMSEIGLNVFAKNMGGLWYDWDKKEYRPKIEW